MTVAGNLGALSFNRDVSIPFNAAQIKITNCYFNFALAFGVNVAAANVTPPSSAFITVDRTAVVKTTPLGTFGSDGTANSSPTATILTSQAKLAI